MTIHGARQKLKDNKEETVQNHELVERLLLIRKMLTDLKDEMKQSHSKAVLLVTSITLVFSHACVFFFEYGMVDEMDYWVGTLGLVVFALLEVVLFMWIFGGENAWKEIHKGCDMKIPRIFYYIMKYITPIYILVLLFAWGVQDGWGILVMQAVPVANRPYIWACRAGMLAVIALFMHFIWKRFHDEDKDSYWLPAALWGYPLLLLIASYPGLFGVDTNGMILLAVSWSLVFGACGFTIFKMCNVPAKSHDDFPDDQASVDTPAA